MEFGYFQNNGTSLWNFVPNSRHWKISPKHIDHHQHCQLCMTNGCRQFITLSVHIRVQHNGRDAVCCIGLQQMRLVSMAMLWQHQKHWHKYHYLSLLFLRIPTNTNVIFFEYSVCIPLSDSASSSSSLSLPSSLWSPVLASSGCPKASPDSRSTNPPSSSSVKQHRHHTTAQQINNIIYNNMSFDALTLLAGRQKEYLACKNWVMRFWHAKKLL